ncbi:MAG: arginine--tRNA ligase [Deltaproteobacteria bacterium]|nr:arginine--tRNA ligase [Deltaproteobacteria bacterium]
MPFLELKRTLAREISNALNLADLTPEVIFHDLANPPNPMMGHVALPTFKMAKTLKRPADQIAHELCEKIKGAELVATPAGPYANFKWSTPNLFQKTIPQVLQQKDTYGTSTSGQGQTIAIEYCSPNVAKKLAFQHSRSTLIGAVLANIYRSQGYTLHRFNFVGDWGAQFARLLAAFHQWGDKTKLQQATSSAATTSEAMDHLMEVYVKFHKVMETDPTQVEKANTWLKRLEEKDETAWGLWKSIRAVSVAAMTATLSRMSVDFDTVEGESAYIDAMESTLAEIKKRANAVISEGAWIVELEGISTPALIQKRDGTTLYLTRDIAAAIAREERLHFAKMLYVVSDQQRLHFQQLFGVVMKMGYAWGERCTHVGFGTVLFGSQKMSTREGRVVLLDEVLDQAHNLALKACTEKNPDLKDKDSVAEAVGMGAFIFGQLSNHRTRDIHFSWEQVLALDGETGPYVQYALVRCRSLLEKALEKKETIAHGPIDTDFSSEEDALILQIARFRGELDKAIREDEPFYLTSYLIDLAKAYSRFYFKMPVLQCTDDKQRSMRLSLVAATGQTLENGLKLLNIQCPPQM